MRKLLLFTFALLTTLFSFSQSTTPKKAKKKYDLSNRAADHFLIQFSRDSWEGAADSVQSRIKGFSKGFNTYLMADFPIKSDKRFSAAIGLGVSTSSIGFKKTIVDVSSNTKTLPFLFVDTVNHYKKFKVATSYLELPVEFRFSSNPEMPGKSVKVALGVKVGTLLNAHSKGKTLQNGSGATIRNTTEKVTSRSYFNATKFAATARIGYGYFSLFGAYNFTNIFKDAAAPNTKLLQLGITISGL